MRSGTIKMLGSEKQYFDIEEEKEKEEKEKKETKEPSFGREDRHESLQCTDFMRGLNSNIHDRMPIVVNSETALYMERCRELNDNIGKSADLLSQFFSGSTESEEVKPDE